jgi:hypothetical protein
MTDDERPPSSVRHGPRQPRTAGDVARGGPVQVALLLLVVLFGLLVLWIVWPMMTGA